MKKVKCFLAVLMLSSVMLLGCGDSAEKVESDSDQCVVVQVPDGSTVEELFTFKQKTQMALSYLEDDSTTVYRIGERSRQHDSLSGRGVGEQQYHRAVSHCFGRQRSIRLFLHDGESDTRLCTTIWLT